MQKWEYSWVGRDRKKGLSASENMEVSDTLALVDFLPEAGIAGWELCGVGPGIAGQDEFTLYFKRPIH